MGCRARGACPCVYIWQAGHLAVSRVIVLIAPPGPGIPDTAAGHFPGPSSLPAGSLVRAPTNSQGA